MFNRKSLASAGAAAVLVSALGLAYAQTNGDSLSPPTADSAAPTGNMTPESSPADVSSMPTYSSSDSTSSTSGTTASSGSTYSADTSAPPATTQALDSESYSEPAPQADRN